MKSARSLIVKARDKAVSSILEKIIQLDSSVNELTVAQKENSKLLNKLNEKQAQGGIMRVNDREIATPIFNGLIMYLDPRDIAITPHIVFSGIWEEWVTKAWIRVLSLQNKNTVVLDIGANNGYYGMLAARDLDKTTSRVILFEPNPNLLPYIHKTLSVNWLNENTIVEPLGVSDKNGNAKLNILQDYTGSSSMHTSEFMKSYLEHKMDIKTEQEVKVKTTTVDAYCTQHNIKEVDMVIMDIEGYEEKAYHGMRNTVAQSKNITFFIEFTPDSYAKPKDFYMQMRADFGNVYTIINGGEEDGRIAPLKKDDYESVIGDSRDYVMLIFSKRKLT